jgi:type III restriction enzyme
MLQLRDYQQRSLEALETYLGLITRHGAKTAFVIQTERPYRSVQQLPALPYVCLRVPTGGGKTLMGCYALGIATKTYLQADRTVCLWLVPSNTIREQTLAALRDRQHPYRQTIDARFSGQVRVMDLTEALYIQRGSVAGETIIIVSTLAALRVQDTEGRKIYEGAGALQHHFDGLNAALAESLERENGGSIIYSLANVLRLWRPIVVMDEAHNARTPLSFDTLARFNPSCIIEFTATPETTHNPEQGLFASNVLHHVSAAELKAEDMVKLPIKLRTHGDWKEIMAETVQMQRTLERVAKDEERQTGEYIRPIVLLQAQPRSQERQTLTVEVVKNSLVDDFKIPDDQIAVATGQTRGIEDLDLFDRACSVRFIITVQALKEGWDCSFAYVLCSVAEISSPRAVEQILGRVLRLPRAKRKQFAELNCAYAFVASPRFIEAASALKDALVQNGFQRLEVNNFVTPQETGSLFHTEEHSVQVSKPPDLSKVAPAIRKCVTYDETTGRLSLNGVIAESEMNAIKGCFANSHDQEAVERIFYEIQGRTLLASPAQGEVFKVPFLAIRVGRELELFEESHFLDVEWNLVEFDASLSDAEFSSQLVTGSGGEIDVTDMGHVEMRQFVDKLHEQLTMLAVETGWTVASLTNWLDRQIPHPDIPQNRSSLFTHKVITGLIQSRGLTIEQLARHKFRLRNAIEAKIDEHRRTQAMKSYNALLFGAHAGNVEVSPELCFSYDKDRYSPNWYYEGNFRFRKHYFQNIGELKPEGEEFECAVLLDNMPQVKYWVRNLERRENSSFWLQTASDRFYPDFVAMLEDERILVVEYKGEDRWSNDDSREKRGVGELWAERSHGHCLFVMPKGKDWAAIKKSAVGISKPAGKLF